LVGIDHGFSFPLQYFQENDLPLNWMAFLDDFQRHWPTDEKMKTSTLTSSAKEFAAKELCEAETERASGNGKALPTFHFDVQGSVGLPLPWAPSLIGFGCGPVRSASAAGKGAVAVCPLNLCPGVDFIGDFDFTCRCSAEVVGPKFQGPSRMRAAAVLQMSWGRGRGVPYGLWKPLLPGELRCRPPDWPGLRSVSRDSYPNSWPIHSGNAKLNRSKPDAMATYCLPRTA
jgi:hypothetical protein